MTDIFGCIFLTILFCAFHLSQPLNVNFLFLSGFQLDWWIFSLMPCFLFTCWKLYNFFIFLKFFSLEMLCARYVKNCFGVPGWLSRLSVWLWLRSWSHGWWVRALCQALVLTAGSLELLWILCLPLSLLLPCSHSVSLSFSKINKNFKKILKTTSIL